METQQWDCGMEQCVSLVTPVSVHSECDRDEASCQSRPGSAAHGFSAGLGNIISVSLCVFGCLVGWFIRDRVSLELTV